MVPKRALLLTIGWVMYPTIIGGGFPWGAGSVALGCAIVTRIQASATWGVAPEPSTFGHIVNFFLLDHRDVLKNMHAHNRIGERFSDDVGPHIINWGVNHITKGCISTLTTHFMETRDTRPMNSVGVSHGGVTTRLNYLDSRSLVSTQCSTNMVDPLR